MHTLNKILKQCLHLFNGFYWFAQTVNKTKAGSKFSFSSSKDKQTSQAKVIKTSWRGKDCVLCSTPTSFTTKSRGHLCEWRTCRHVTEVSGSPQGTCYLCEWHNPALCETSRARFSQEHYREGWRRQPVWSRSQATSLAARSLSCSRKMNPGLEQVLWLATALLSLGLISLI